MSIPKPRSMPTGFRNILRPNDSTSLWNCTLSPGWTQEESDILRDALIYYGIGNWKDIIEHGCLPDKTNAQMNLQLQRMLGQQSTAEFQNLHIDPYVIGKINSQKQGPNIRRKNGFIINTGGKLSREDIRRKIQENKENYELPKEEWSKIVLPNREVVIKNKVQEAINEKREKLNKLEDELDSVLKAIVNRRRELRGMIPLKDSEMKSLVNRSAKNEGENKTETTNNEESNNTNNSDDIKDENNETSTSSHIFTNNDNELSENNSSSSSSNSISNKKKRFLRREVRRGKRRYNYDDDDFMPSGNRSRKSRKI
ncbi:hypothetical protein BCR32DRAFT_281187 [Anaeromyces robustus]|uniref:Myb-like domain-containing protein n=1 Tax=Anaeromyces robustus TaxID=1754192 RepID=A0A1Y1X2R3_9FUNG|nr:hypothetical protein BCR32DRAFT_281187 [Anaeromyces robustus]|eukprot:ORX79686.1 hypothetical protein BCR32DRAFT_281187 [Anaeromyces robustus]